MCIHTHQDSKLLRNLTRAMMAAYAAFPMTLVNTRKQPHEHFTLYAAKDTVCAQRAANLLNAWHPEVYGCWDERSEKFVGFRNKHESAEYPSVEWPDGPTAPFVYAICFAYGTMTKDRPGFEKSLEMARGLSEQDDRATAISLVHQIFGQPEGVFAAELASTVEDVDNTVWRVLWTSDDGFSQETKFPFSSTSYTIDSGVLIMSNGEGYAIALFKNWTAAIRGEA